MTGSGSGLALALRAALDRELADAVRLRHELHAGAELSGSEHQTAARVAAALGEPDAPGREHRPAGQDRCGRWPMHSGQGRARRPAGCGADRSALGVGERRDARVRARRASRGAGRAWPRGPQRRGHGRPARGPASRAPAAGGGLSVRRERHRGLGGVHGAAARTRSSVHTCSTRYRGHAQPPPRHGERAPSTTSRSRSRALPGTPGTRSWRSTQCPRSARRCWRCSRSPAGGRTPRTPWWCRSACSRRGRRRTSSPARPPQGGRCGHLTLPTGLCYAARCGRSRSTPPARTAAGPW